MNLTKTFGFSVIKVSLLYDISKKDWFAKQPILTNRLFQSSSMNEDSLKSSIYYLLMKVVTCYKKNNN